MDIEQRYQVLSEAIDEERKAEEAFFISLSEKRTLKEKAEEGYIWYPVEIDAVHYSTGEYLEVKIKQKAGTVSAEQHKFKVGVSVQLFNSGPEVEPVKGVVSYIKKETLSILTKVEKEQIDDFQTGLSGIELVYDEKPYKVMKTALREVLHSTRPEIRILKKALAVRLLEDNTLPGENNTRVTFSSGLNESQQKALLTSLQARYMAIIHGPPGTGKTTTLVALAKEILQKEKRILVCASSNNATDLLASRLHAEGLQVLRVGNVTRIHDELADLTLIEKMRSHEDWNTVKKMKIQADQVSRQASQYKRSFGQEEREKRKQLKKESREIHQWARELEDRISEEILHKSQVIATTLISAGHPLLNPLKFTTVIIDEASQALEPECWNAILKAERVILAGDHHQLPPTIKSQGAREKGLETTILDLMTDYIKESSLLTIQYRMNQKILGFSNKLFYDGKLMSFPKVENQTLPGDQQPIVLVDTAGCGFDEYFNPKQKSFKNEGEYFILREYILAKKESFLGATIGIISPYAEQVRFIADQISDEKEFSGMDMEINTIDGFQGQEKDIILVSLVRSNDKGDIGFLKDARRLNVALTRARKKLVVIGDSATIGPHSLYEKLITYIVENQGSDSAWNYMRY
jgi:ATP-dependent RNA/DNA helicase IGHMBP2